MVRVRSLPKSFRFASQNHQCTKCADKNFREPEVLTTFGHKKIILNFSIKY